MDLIGSVNFILIGLVAGAVIAGLLKLFNQLTTWLARRHPHSSISKTKPERKLDPLPRAVVEIAAKVVPAWLAILGLVTLLAAGTASVTILATLPQFSPSLTPYLFLAVGGVLGFMITHYAIEIWKEVINH